MSVALVGRLIGRGRHRARVHARPLQPPCKGFSRRVRGLFRPLHGHNLQLFILGFWVFPVGRPTFLWGALCGPQRGACLPVCRPGKPARQAVRPSRPQGGSTLHVFHLPRKRRLLRDV